MAILWRFEDCR